MKNTATDARSAMSVPSGKRPPLSSPKSKKSAASPQPTSCAKTPAGNTRSATAAEPVIGENETLWPWPHKDLNPNARKHWTRRASAAKAYRMTCFVMARVDKVKAGGDGPIALHIEFAPPDRRPRDLDNMLASIKSGLDGLAQALGVNDKRFTLRLSVLDQVGGYVRVRVA